ncbi:hypothetical protein HNQ59_001281 [Chitinivorax tropicus]|uniref:Uncharacterized protein n=1 Tax=Chitinivorax tropicus TaxID=714531 RepID=A0A840MNB4_9PROT|nr:hypothetical protein [Chitinivorax tropicus]
MIELRTRYMVPWVVLISFGAKPAGKLVAGLT